MVQDQTDRKQSYNALAERQRPHVSSCGLEETSFIGASITIRSLVHIKQDQSLQPILPFCPYIFFFDVVPQTLVGKDRLRTIQIQLFLSQEGSTSHAFAKNTPTDLIKCLGDWRSECYRQYLKDDLTLRLSAARGCYL